MNPLVGVGVDLSWQSRCIATTNSPSKAQDKESTRRQSSLICLIQAHLRLQHAINVAAWHSRRPTARTLRPSSCMTLSPGTYVLIFTLTKRRCRLTRQILVIFLQTMSRKLCWTRLETTMIHPTCDYRKSQIHQFCTLTSIPPSLRTATEPYQPPPLHFTARKIRSQLMCAWTGAST